MCNFFLTLLLALPLVMTSAPAQSQSLTFTQILDRAERKTTQPDHTIAYGKDALQYGELWLPRVPSNDRLAVVVLIHGGCWRADLPGPELVSFLADDLRKHGVAVWSLTYRRVGHDGGGYPGTFNDVANGVDHLRLIKDKYNLDLTRAVVTGHSAGGHLALWVAAQNKIAAGSVLKRTPLVNFRAVIGIAAIADLAHFARAGAHACGDKTIDQLVDTATRTMRGDPVNAPSRDVSAPSRDVSAPSRDVNAPYRDTSPSEMLPLNVKQILIHGVFDGIVPPAIGFRYQARAKEFGESVELITLENAGHFELIAPWTPAGRVVVAKILGALK